MESGSESDGSRIVSFDAKGHSSSSTSPSEEKEWDVDYSEDRW
jgi:hypothetical protein